MHLVISANRNPPSKVDWANPDHNSRGEWSEIYEAVTNWFCYSNGLRKEHDLDIIIGERTIRIHGDEVRYLAPSLRSVASLIWHAFNNKQPGIEGIASVPFTDYGKPHYVFSSDLTLKYPKIDLSKGTLFLNPLITIEEKLIPHGVTKIPVIGRFNSQKLVSLLYQ